MTDNETISRARGEERLCGPSNHFAICKCGALILQSGDCIYDTAPSYSTDPAAWDSDLYAWIEGEGLLIPFMFNLNGSFTVPKNISTIGWQWLAMTSDCGLKAQALAQAIKEAGK